MTTTETKWTPGPWRTSSTEPPGDWVIHAKGVPQQMAYLAQNTKVEWPLKANAHLIAAAPELYEALRALIERYEEVVQDDTIGRGLTDHDLINARSALARARGEQP